MFFVVKVNEFQGSTARPATSDKNGQFPVILNAHNGTLPANARVLSGTVAQRAGLEIGKNYAVKVILTGVDTTPQKGFPNGYGEQYRYEVAGEVSTIEIITKLKEFGIGAIQSEVVVNAEPKVTSFEKVAP